MLTIINFFKRFVGDLWRAIVFAVLEYDEKLKLTKTTTQRFVIWSLITILVLVLLFVFVRVASGIINLPHF